MKVVFLQDVTNVAKARDVKEVAKGYARNYLFPNDLAVPATQAELSKLESRLQADARNQTRLEQEAESLAQELANLNLVLKVRAGSRSRLYGAITTADIAKEIKRVSGHDFDKRSIGLERPIHELGTYQVSLKLSKNITASINILVEQEAGKTEPSKSEIKEPAGEQAAEPKLEQAPETEHEEEKG